MNKLKSLKIDLSSLRDTAVIFKVYSNFILVYVKGTKERSCLLELQGATQISVDFVAVQLSNRAYLLATFLVASK